MKILQVLTLLSSTGAFGGPATVALHQSAALADRGHQVTLIAGRIPGDRVPPTAGVRTRTFAARRLGPGRSFTRLLAPGMAAWLAVHAREFDVAHVHLGRDLISLPAARLLQAGGIPTHVQTHGMIAPRLGLPHRTVDAAATRAALTRAASVFCLDDAERRGLRTTFGTAPAYRLLTNGVPVPPSGSPAADPDDRAGDAEVLFLARLHPRKRPAVFAQAAVTLAAHRAVRFTLVGPDEGEAAAVDAIIAGLRPEARGSVVRESAIAPGQVPARMARAAVYVLPAVGEPLGMTVLEAMAQGVPVVVTESCGLAPTVAAADAGLVVDESVAGLRTALAELLDEPAAARARGRRGRDAVCRDWSVAAIAESLENHYRAAARPTEEHPDA